MHHENFHESHESIDYNLNITLHRHGPKTDLNGDLSERGQEITEDYFRNSYKNITSNLINGQGIEIEHSPVRRVKQTAIADAKFSGQDIKSIKEDDRLSEGAISKYPDLVKSLGGIGGRWMSKWLDLAERPMPDVKTGQEAVRDLSKWLLDKITIINKQRESSEIDAFSHVPVIIVFLATLERKLGIKLLPPDWTNNSDSRELVDYLQEINISYNSADPDNLTLRFRDGNYIIPLKIIESLSK